jgi:hypothetical protein
MELEQAREEGKREVGGSSGGSGWDAARPGMSNGEGHLQNAATAAESVGAATVAFVASFCRCTGVCTTHWRQSKSSDCVNFGVAKGIF